MNDTHGLLLDTHAWVWFVAGEPRLRVAARKRIKLAQDDSHAIAIAAITLWEVAFLESRARLNLGSRCRDWISSALAKPSIIVEPLSPDVAVESANLPGEFHGDPADRLIVATARRRRLTLVTADKRILSYGKDGYVDVLKAG